MTLAAAAPDAHAERRNAAIYLTGLGASLIGNSALSLVAGIWVKTLTGSSEAAGLVSVCIYLPSLLAPLGGVLADRVRQRRLLSGLDVASAAVVAALLLVRSRHDVWLVYLVMLWYGTALMLAGPAESALFARMFSPATRARVNGRSVALQEAGRLVAPLAGAALFAATGGGTVAVLDAATFLIGAAATMLIRVDDAPATPGARGPWRDAVAAGLRQLWAIRELRTVTVLAAVPMLLSGLLVAAQYSLVAALDRPPSFLGVLAACQGAGSILASLVAGRVVNRFGERAVALVALLNMVLASVLRATGSLVPVVAGSLVLGAALPWSLIALITASQRLVDRAVQGQVSAAVTLVMFAPLPVSQTVGAGLVDPLGYRALYLSVAALLLVTCAIHVARRRAPAPHPGGRVRDRSRRRPGRGIPRLDRRRP